MEFGPQGDGTHGSYGTSSCSMDIPFFDTNYLIKKSFPLKQK